MIVYPAIDIYEGRAVRMTRGDFATVEQVAASPLEAAKKLVAEGAEWLHVIDLDGSRTGKPANLDHIRAIANRFTVKIQAGGGIRDFDTAEAFAEAGASRIVVGTAAIGTKKVRASTLLIWGEDDVALGIELTQGMEGLLEREPRVEYLPDTGHFVMEERPEVVNRLLLEFLA
ncbi:MAG TPA: HisA/HisF-related TIM barrel protein [Candidatus Limnocylindria bacterium]|nr:HisA/HisF-related TIM barrel protein [Candidatus Limnocylindria bacterium]